MKKALIAALLLVPFLSLASDIREGNQDKSVAPTPLDQCVPNQSAQEWLQTLPTGDSQSDSTQRFTDYVLKSQTVIQSQPEYNFCRMRFTAERNRFLSDGQGNWYQPSNGGTQTTSKDVNGTIEQVPSCLNNPADQGKPYSEQHTILYTDNNGTSMCFSPQDMAEIDTCSEGTEDPYFQYVGRDAGVSCIEKDDGSVCPVNSGGSITSNGSGDTTYFWTPASPVSSSSCYVTSNSGSPSTIPDIPQTTGECTNFNGLSLCYENPLNVCDSNGSCPTGCGTVAANGQVGFVCVSTDTDGDGLPDYLDPDIDGDGIPNEQDLDKDGDGVEDAKTPQPELKELRDLLVSIKNNTGNTATNTNRIASGTGGTGNGGDTGDGNGGGGTVVGGGGASASQIGEQLTEKLTEVSDVERKDDVNAIQGLFDSVLSGMDELLENEQIDLTKTIQESDVSNSFSELEQYFRANCSAANIRIPNTNASFDVCGAANKVRPYLWIMFAVLTALYCFYRVIDTARKT